MQSLLHRTLQFFLVPIEGAQQLQSLLPRQILRCLLGLLFFLAAGLLIRILLLLLLIVWLLLILLLLLFLLFLLFLVLLFLLILLLLILLLVLLLLILFLLFLFLLFLKAAQSDLQIEQGIFPTRLES